jgi:hypothetical protein
VDWKQRTSYAGEAVRMQVDPMQPPILQGQNSEWQSFSPLKILQLEEAHTPCCCILFLILGIQIIPSYRAAVVRSFNVTFAERLCIRVSIKIDPIRTAFLAMMR